MYAFTVLTFVFVILFAAHSNPKGFNLASSSFGFLIMGAFAVLLLMLGMPLALFIKITNGEFLMGYYGVAVFTSLSAIAAFFAFFFWQDYQNEKKITN